MWKWCLLALALFAGINWFLLPNFPVLNQYVNHLSILGAIGLSGFVMALSLIFGKGK